MGVSDGHRSTGDPRSRVKFLDTEVADAWVIEPEPHHDERGLFARTWDSSVWAARGLPSDFTQCSVSFNPRSRTLRGMHYQRAPHQETKLVRCTRGRIQDVVLDLRVASPTYMRHTQAQLSADNRLAVLVPPGCAHGFLTLEPDTEVFYQISGAYVPGAVAGVLWNDDAFGVSWAAAPEVISPRDAAYPPYAV